MPMSPKPSDARRRLHRLESKVFAAARRHLMMAGAPLLDVCRQESPAALGLGWATYDMIMSSEEIMPETWPVKDLITVLEPRAATADDEVAYQLAFFRRLMRDIAELAEARERAMALPPLAA
jgi:hypothetical protein